MKKQILELLRELEGLMDDYLTEIQICSDYSGSIVDSEDRYIIIFESEKELIQGLKDKIKELKK